MLVVARHGLSRHAVTRFLPCTTASYGFRAASNFSPPQSSSSTERVLAGFFEPRATPNPQAKSIAVLGGGITGLSTAYNITKHIPHATVTLYEKSDRLGGWVDSEYVDVDDGQVLFEWGPRTLRPDIGGSGAATLHLIGQLGDLHKQVRGIPYAHPAATNRYVYYPDHLVRMPGPNPSKGFVSQLFRNLYTALTEPLFSGAFTSLAKEPVIPTRQPHVQDESIGDFLQRRFGSAITDNMVSALFHGIYAGDIYKLSARQLLPALWYLEARDVDGNGVIGEFAEMMFRQTSIRPFRNVQFHNRYHKDLPGSLQNAFFMQQMKGTSVYSFAKGLGQLTDSIEQELTKNSNVILMTGADVQGLKYDKSRRTSEINIAGTPGSMKHDYVVSSLNPDAFAKLVTHEQTSEQQQDQGLAGLATTLSGKVSSVNVMVVNLYYQNPKLLSVSGFGYLIPRSVPSDQNPERALGVIFGSETAGPRGKDAEQKLEIRAPSAEDIETYKKEYERIKSMFEDNSSVQSDRLAQNMMRDSERAWKEVQRQAKEGDRVEVVRLGQDTASGTKMTVMLGGHWWDGWSKSDLPSEDEGIEMAKAVLARHLKIFEQPMLAQARMQWQCIPQYPVGYRDRMKDAHEKLLQEFGGRVKVAGPFWQGGVGFNDCTRKAREVVTSIREGWDTDTGLEEYAETEKWVLFDRRSGHHVMDPLQKK